MKVFKIDSEYITITQLLKANDYISSGGEAKYFLAENDCYLNGVKITERGKKIRNYDQVIILNDTYMIKND